jgi:DNA-binding transcriptional MerR regulator
VRYYVQEGLIPPPLGVGRGNHYTAEHLERVLRVKGMQEAGATLDEIRRALDASVDRQARAGAPHDEPAPARSLWRRIEVAPGVELHLASSVRLPAPGRLRELAEWCRKHFAEQVHSTDEKDEDRDG